MDVRFVYITAADREQAETIGRTLVEERLAACANILPQITSFYWWEGAVQHEREAVLIAKSRAELVDRIVARVRALHSYSVPCVVALPIEQGNADFLRWVERETDASPSVIV